MALMAYTVWEVEHTLFGLRHEDDDVFNEELNFIILGCCTDMKATQ